MDNQETLKQFQDDLADLLNKPLAPNMVLATLKDDPRFGNYRDYVNTFDVDMIAVAQELMKKWGVPK